MSNTPLVSIQQAITRTKSDAEVTITEVITSIQSGMYGDRISQIRDRAEQGADKKELNKLKAELLPTYTPHGTFTYRNEHSAQTHSNIAFVDIDGKDNSSYSVDEIKHRLSELPFVFAAYVSSTGTGVHALASTDSIRDDYSVQTITEASSIVYSIVESETGLKCDHSCKDISRACFMSSDPELFFDASRLPSVTNIPQEKVSFSDNLPTGEHITTERYLFRARGTVEEIDFGGEISKYFGEGVEWFSVFLPDTRCGHRKKSMYHALAQFCLGNPHAGKGAVEQTAMYLNTKMEKPLDREEVLGIVRSIMKRRDAKGFTTSKMKKVVFNPEAKLSAKEKRTIAAKTIGKARSESTRSRIKEAVMKLTAEGKRATQREVSVLTGLSIATVKRYLGRKGIIQ